MAFNGEQDHGHLLLKLNLKTVPSVEANNLKSVTARLLREEFGKALAKTYWKRAVEQGPLRDVLRWGPLEVIKAYVQGQARPE